MQHQKNNSQSSFFSKAMNPYLIAGFCLAGAVLFMIMGKITNSLGVTTLSERFSYISVGSFMLLFAIYNAVFSLNAADLNQYWIKSFVAYVGLVAGGLLFAYLFSSLWLPGTFRWIFFYFNLWLFSPFVYNGFCKTDVFNC